MPLEATVQILFWASRGGGLAVVILARRITAGKSSWTSPNQRIASLKAERASLQQIKLDVDRFESRKASFRQRIDVIETCSGTAAALRTLLQMVANTVVRVDALWLTSLDTKGDPRNSGVAGNINAVANFITELKRSGYFDQIEIKSRQGKRPGDCRRDLRIHDDSGDRSLRLRPRRCAADRACIGAPAQSPQPAAKGRS